jgi:hypothetical protein
MTTEKCVIADPNKTAGRAFIFIVELGRDKRISSIEAAFLHVAIWPLIEKESDEAEAEATRVAMVHSCNGAVN